MTNPIDRRDINVPLFKSISANDLPQTLCCYHSQAKQNLSPGKNIDKIRLS